MSDEPTVVRLIEAQAARTPDLPAVVGDDARLTYAEVDTATARIAAAVRRHTSGRDVLVAVLARRGAMQLTALLGVLRAGAAYVCVDADQPRRRQATQLADAALVLSDQELSWHTGPVLTLKDLPGAPGAHIDPPAAEDLAYVLYTSGSTGDPKGVAVTHAGLANYARHLVGLLGCAAGDAFATVTSLSTDLGNTAVFPALISGGCVHVVATDAARDPVEFAEYMIANRIDHLKITPSHLAALLEYPDPEILPRQTLLLGGEATRWSLVDRVRAIGGCRVVNHYGPTETTIGSLTYEVRSATAQHRGCATVPVGRPITATTVHVVDGDLRPVPAGTPGELLISGAGLARGYWRSPEATAQRFITLADGTRAYRTGDRVRLLDDGVIEFLGRLDLQVKIRGFRVELGEIEAVLGGHPNVAAAAVVPVTEDGDLRLAGHVVTTGTVRPTPAQLRRYLAEWLPSHMVPDSIRVVAQLPYTRSGKLDRAGLAQGAV